MRKIKDSAHHPFIYFFSICRLASIKRKKKGGGTDCFHNPLSFAYSQIIDVIYRFISLYPLYCELTTQINCRGSFKVISLHSFFSQQQERLPRRHLSHRATYFSPPHYYKPPAPKNDIRNSPKIGRREGEEHGFPLPCGWSRPDNVARQNRTYQTGSILQLWHLT